MRAKLNMNQGMNYLVNYNEEKVTKKEAECLYAGNFLQDAGDLTTKEKKARFAGLIELNPQTIRPGTTLVVEFAPGERLPKSDLIDIACDLMDGIGFGEQPFLVYRHDDTHHQHMHIISTKVKSDGDLIPESFIGVRLLQPTARRLEKKYDLALESPEDQPRHNPREKIQYGKTATWQAVSDTLQYVLENYHYRNVAELDAALRLYNLTVKGGAPGTRMHEHGGLIYQILDEQGKPRNKPMKASKLPFKATLKNLEPRFAANRSISADEVSNVRYTLEEIFQNKPATTENFHDQLRRNRLAVVPVSGLKGEMADLHFVDLSTKRVLSVADLGSGYTAAAMRDRLGFDPLVRSGERIEQSQQKTQSLRRGLHL